MGSSFDSTERRWIAAAALGLALFAAALASVLAGAGLVALDAPARAWLARVPAPLPQAAGLVGSAWGVAPLVAGAAAFFLWKRRPWNALRVALLPALGELVVQVLKRVVARPRPENPFSTTFSFPSGHATSAAILACLLVWFAFSAPRRRPVALAMVAAALAWALVMAAMRVALGVHYASDVVGGLGLGAAIGGAGLVAIARAERRRSERAA